MPQFPSISFVSRQCSSSNAQGFQLHRHQVSEDPAPGLPRRTPGGPKELILQTYLFTSEGLGAQHVWLLTPFPPCCWPSVFILRTSADHSAVVLDPGRTEAERSFSQTVTAPRIRRKPSA
ncbi:hypothetical protein GRJ2_001882800 [Grus japonensis]|uniref:Uncharacterized protein n=1 Tax=Grus japonensis TaxID=30415 RepID=A0ABC9XAL6_GRUJA